MRPEFFELNKGPFEAEPDFELSYFSEQHGRAVNLMAHALWNRACLVTILGDEGVGKSMLATRFRKGLRSTHGLIQVSAQTPKFRAVIAGELAQYLSSVPELAGDDEIAEACRAFASQGRCLTLLVDDVDRLTPEQLLELHWLGRLQAGDLPAVNFILLGRPGLKQRLRDNLRSVVENRRWHRFYIRRMGEEETGYYITRRLRLAGAAASSEVFTPTAQHLIYRYTSGNPAEVNRLCRAAMECAENRRMLFVSDREVAMAIELLDMALEPQQLEHPARRKSDQLQSAAKPRARLVHTDAGEFIAELPLGRPRILLGRDLANDVVIGSGQASRYHAAIFSDARGLLLVDLHSTNGTLVNGKLVTKCRLRDGDVITIGSSDLAYANELERLFDEEAEELGRETTVLDPDTAFAARKG